MTSNDEIRSGSRKAAGCHSAFWGRFGDRRLHHRRLRETGLIVRGLGYNTKARDLRHHEPEIADGFPDFVVGRIQLGALLLSNERGAELPAELLVVCEALSSLSDLFNSKPWNFISTTP